MGKKKSYNRMYNNESVEKKEVAPVESEVETVETVEIVETVAEPVVETKSVTKTGVVVDCTGLNVREYPDRKANVISILMADSEVQVNVDEALDEWYHVFTATGLDGFCMKKYIALKE